MNVVLFWMMEHDHDVHGAGYDDFEQILSMGVDVVAGTFAEVSVGGSGG